jgi:hypothetical protein
MRKKQIIKESHLRVYEDRSEYYSPPDHIQVFPEGLISNQAKKRIKRIKDSFQEGFLSDLIINLKNGTVNCQVDKVSQETQQSLRQLVGLVTSEVGRALVGLTVMQLCIKTIAPDQSIRLHKASSNKSSFSWVDGVSMRTLDKTYVTPTLRKHDLVKLNADGFMMTRSLAENYPYSKLYKAQLRGAREQWLTIVEELENNLTEPRESLIYILSLLINAAGEFNHAATDLVNCCSRSLHKFNSRTDVKVLLDKHAESSDYAARLLEISMHSLLQAAIESGSLGHMSLNPLSQMRSANKKHGNVGDIELLEGGEIIHSWDAKYGKGYLREEIEEAAEKIPNHSLIQTVGFVTNVEIQRTSEIDQRINDLSELHGVSFEIISYNQWVDNIFNMCVDSKMVEESQLAKSWIESYVYTLARTLSGDFYRMEYLVAAISLRTSQC